MSTLDILVPTRHRPTALAVTLASLIGQTFTDFDVVISDQSDGEPSYATAECRSVIRVLEARGSRVRCLRNLPRRGLAHQRQFLLDHATAPRVLYVDDDVILEAPVAETMLRAMDREGCGLVGSAVIGLSYKDDVRPHQQHIEFWDGPVHPEAVQPDTPQWQRHHLHSAANLWHVQRAVGATYDEPRLYRIAWAGGCVLFDTAKLRAAGGFGFWASLPAEHCGEDVLAQIRVMERFGGCGLLPSGAYHQELPTTVPDREVDAPFVLGATPATPREPMCV